MVGKSTQHSAAGSYLGYGVQTYRMCARLLSAPADATVHIEKEDDVSVHYSDGAKLLEQCKRVKSNPLADWSVDLWKTLHNWLVDCSPIDLASKERFCLYATPPGALTADTPEPGKFVEALAAAKTDSDVAALVASIRAEVTSAKKATRAYGYAKRFLDASFAEQCAFAKRFEFITEADPAGSISQNYALAVDPALLPRIVAYALGEAKARGRFMLESGKPEGILAGEFQHEIRTFVQNINLPAFFDFDLPSPTPGSVDAKFAARPVFIRQLELIEADKAQQMNAVSDFLRATASKTQWAADGVLLPASLTEWEAALLGRHGAICGNIHALHGTLSVVQRGQAVYAQCRQVSPQLQGRSVPDHFVHGCFNGLADQKKVGWHPDFALLLD